jgi:nitric oxide reductase activation protein
MKLGKAEIRREIEKIRSSYDTKDIFSSPYLEDILQAVVTSACKILARIPVVKAFCDERSDFTACTEGSTVTINTLGPLIRERDTNWDKYVNLVGHVMHECGHVLFTDFVEMINLMDAWVEGNFTFYPKKPDVEGIDVDQIIEYLNTHPNYRKMFLNEMKTIENVMEDVYIENQLFDHFDGVAALGLAKSREELYRLSPIESEVYDKVLSGEITPLVAFSQILLAKRTGYPLKEAESLTDDQKSVKELIDAYFELCEEEIDRLKWEGNGKVRDMMLNRILVKVKPLLPEPLDNEDMYDPGEGINEMIQQLLDQMSEKEGGSDQSDRSDNGDSSPDYSDDAADQQTTMSGKMSEKAGASKMPQGSSRPVTSDSPDKDSAESSEKKAKQMSASDDAMKHKFEQAVKDIAEKDFEARDEKKHAKELQEEADDIETNCQQSCGDGGRFVGYRTERQVVDSSSRKVYEEVYSEVSQTSKHLSKKLKNLLDVRELESLDSGYLMGQRFNSRDVIRGDGKYFSRISAPGDKIRVCFGVLVDESGSMCGEKAASARRATILLEDTLRNTGVPFIIVGHTESWADGKVVLKNYVDFDTNDGKDQYRLSGITGHGGNIDGAAISYVGEKLLKRPEEQKVMIVISDGEPAGCSFFSNNYEEDTMMAVAHYRKKGINVFGAVVDEWERVSRLYGDQYSFDCRENGELERQLIRLVKRYVKEK